MARIKIHKGHYRFILGVVGPLESEFHELHLEGLFGRLFLSGVGVLIFV